MHALIERRVVRQIDRLLGRPEDVLLAVERLQRLVRQRLVKTIQRTAFLSRSKPTFELKESVGDRKCSWIADRPKQRERTKYAACFFRNGGEKGRETGCGHFWMFFGSF